MKLSFVLLLISIIKNFDTSFAVNEHSTKEEIISHLIQEIEDDERIQSVIDILMNQNLLSKIGGAKTFHVLNALKIISNAQGSANVTYFFKNFLPLHAVDLFEAFPEQMLQCIKKASLNSLEYFGNLQNFENILKILLIKYEEDGSHKVVEFLEDFKHDQKFSSVIRLFNEEIQESKLEFSLDEADFFKVASWLPLIKPNDLRSILECLMLKYKRHFTYIHNSVENHTFLQAGTRVQKKICLKTQELTDSDFSYIWEEFINQGGLCAPQALHLLNKKKFEHSGILLTILSEKMHKNEQNYEKKREMFSAIAGKFFPQYRVKKFLKNETMFKQKLIESQYFLNSLKNITIFSGNQGYFLLDFLQEYPHMSNFFEFRNYLDKWAPMDQNIKQISCACEDESSFNDVYYDEMKANLNCHKEAQNFPEKLLQFIGLFSPLHFNSTLQNTLYHDVILYLPYVKKTDLFVILEWLVSKDSEYQFFNQSQDEQKNIFFKINELTGDEFLEIIQKISNFSKPICQDVLSVLKKTFSD
ncbi:hypothetical protein P618_200914 [Holospora obtusa F1]|uniref:Uncharacterized protein n=1 Tax=Holospora obtusa F1 TaxID=1399147 RepID=W6TT21_HOLOB|nr:hypothetical protein [Holospora obtusa]ETZ06912.1 hypothetical protein P618_200914 [Holospora obtusa F1]